MCCLTIVAVIAGCGPSPQQAIERVDTDVYDIINRKWDGKFGPETTYKLRDTNSAEDTIEAEKSIPESRIVTLAHAVALATSNNRQYQTQKDAVYLKALDLRLVRHEFELQYFGGGFGLYNHLDSVDAIGGGPDFKNDWMDGNHSPNSSIETLGARGDLGLSLLLATGARIGARITANWGRILTDGLGTSLISILSAEIVQPLLRGSDRQVIMEGLTQAERDTVYQIRTFNRFRKKFIVDIVTRYYFVLQLKDNLDNAEKNYRALDDLYPRIETLTAAGQLPRYELEQAQQDRLEALDTYVKAEKSYRQALDEFKITLSLPTAIVIELDRNELSTLTVDAMPGDFDEEEAVAAALNTRLDLANMSDAVLDGKRKIHVAADALGMELNLVASTRNQASNSRTGEFENFGNSDSFRFDDTRAVRIAEIDDIFTAGIEFDLGLDKVAEENELRRSVIALARQERDFEQATDEVVLDVRNAYRDLQEAHDRYAIQSESLKLARQRVDNTLLLLQYSSRDNRRAGMRDVLDAQEDLFAAQIEAVDALVDFNVSTLELYRDTGILQVKPDGMWRKQEVAAANVTHEYIDKWMEAKRNKAAGQ